jgi:hypothetical protein
MSNPHTWGPDESLTDVLTALGYEHTFSDGSLHGVHTIKRDGVEVYSSTRSNAYELCVLWLLRTRQVRLTSGLERSVNWYRRFGLSAEVDAALAAAREGVNA